MRFRPQSKVIYYLLVLTVLTSLAFAFSLVTHSGVTVRKKRRDLPRNEGYESISSQVGRVADVLKYVPAEASVADPDKNVIFDDLDGDGKNEAIVFYTMLVGGRGRADILVLKSSAAGYERLWENTYVGSAGFFDPTGVYDVNKTGKPQIVAYRIVGASCPGVLDIFQYSNGKIEKITGDWADTCQSDLEIKDLDGDGIDEIIFRPLKYGVNRRVYSWNGKEYARTDEQHAYYFNDELQQLVGWIYEHRPLPTSARTTLCEQAVQIYLLQRRYAEAIQLCKAALPMIDDPELTLPNGVAQPNSVARTTEGRQRVLSYFEVDKIREKARIYRLLADAFKASGDLRSAKKHRAVAKKLETEAAEKNSRLQ